MKFCDNSLIFGAVVIRFLASEGRLHGDVLELAKKMLVSVLAEGLPGQWCALSLAATSPFSAWSF